MKLNISKAIAMILAFCVTFSGLSLLVGSLDVNAASAAKKITLKATASGTTRIKLKWNEVKSPGKGYAVFRDGKVIKRLSTKKTSFTDKGLKPGTKHKYQIKTYTKKKVTKWYNKKTGKWQKKKPAKKYRGKSKKVRVYVYKKKSNIVKIRTKASSKKSQTSDQDDSDSGSDKTADDTGNDDSDTPATEDTDKPKYTYKIHFLNEPYGNGGQTVIYLETDNPNVYNYELGLLNSSNQAKKLNISKAYYKNDGTTSSDYQDLNLPLTSGYLAICRPECVGNCKIVVYEYNDEGRSIVATKSVNIKDYTAEEAAWRQSVINQVTTSNMTKADKLQAICTYIKGEFKYSKVPVGATATNLDDEVMIHLISDVGVPYWIEKRLDSYTSPELLVKFGQDLGYPLHNCYYDYPRGSTEWLTYHYRVYSETDNRYFEACPTFGYGAIDPNSIVMFNPNTYQFWGE